MSSGAAPVPTVRAPLPRRLLAEALGTAALVTVVVGSGIAAQELSPGAVGLQLLENSTATVFGLTVLILIFGPVSGAHFNPVVSAADWLLNRGRGGLSGTGLLAYTLAQTAGGIGGALLANAMFARPVLELSGHHRLTAPVALGEVVATAGLVLVIFALLRGGQARWVAPAVGGYIGAAYWFTSSTSFANPAVTVGRVFSDTFAGIAAGSVPGFVLAQFVGGAVGALLLLALYPSLPPDPAPRAVERPVTSGRATP